jgi:hypothetical protein
MAQINSRSYNPKNSNRPRFYSITDLPISQRQTCIVTQCINKPILAQQYITNEAQAEHFDLITRCYKYRKRAEFRQIIFIS